jgi:hypothetical protein
MVFSELYLDLSSHPWHYFLLLSAFAIFIKLSAVSDESSSSESAFKIELRLVPFFGSQNKAEYVFLMSSLLLQDFNLTSTNLWL